MTFSISHNRLLGSWVPSNDTLMDGAEELNAFPEVGTKECEILSPSLNIGEEEKHPLLAQAETFLNGNSFDFAFFRQFHRDIISSQKWPFLEALIETGNWDNSMIPILKAGFLCLADGVSFLNGKWKCRFEIDGKIFSFLFPEFQTEDKEALEKSKSIFQEKIVEEARQKLTQKIVESCPSKSENILSFFLQLGHLQPLTSSLLIHGKIVISSLQTIFSRFQGKLDQLPLSLWTGFISIVTVKKNQCAAWKKIFLDFCRDSSLPKEANPFLIHLLKELDSLDLEKSLTSEEKATFDLYRLSQNEISLKVKDNPSFLRFLGCEREEVKKKAYIFKGIQNLDLFKANLRYLLNQGFFKEALNLLSLQTELEGFTQIQKTAQDLFYGIPSGREERLSAYRGFVEEVIAKEGEEKKCDIILNEYAYFYFLPEIASFLEKKYLIGKTDFTFFSRAIEQEGVKETLEKALTDRIDELLKNSDIKPVVICVLLKYLSLTTNNTDFISDSLIHLVEKTKGNPVKKALTISKTKEYFLEHKDVGSKCFASLIKNFSEDQADFIEVFLEKGTNADKISLAEKCLLLNTSKVSEPDEFSTELSLFDVAGSSIFSIPSLSGPEKLFNLSITDLSDLRKINSWNVQTLDKGFEILSKGRRFSKRDLAEAFFSQLSLTELFTPHGKSFIERLLPFLGEASKEACVQKAFSQWEKSTDEIPLFVFLLKDEFAPFLSGEREEKLFSSFISHLEKFDKILRRKDQHVEIQKQQIKSILEQLKNRASIKKTAPLLAFTCCKCSSEEPLISSLFAKALESVINLKDLKKFKWDSTKKNRGLEFLKENPELLVRFQHFIMSFAEENGSYKVVEETLSLLDLSIGENPENYSSLLNLARNYLSSPLDKDPSLISKVGQILEIGESLKISEELQVELCCLAFTYACEHKRGLQKVEKQVMKCPSKYLAKFSSIVASMKLSYRSLFISGLLKRIASDSEMVIESLYYQLVSLENDIPGIDLSSSLRAFALCLLENYQFYPKSVSKCAEALGKCLLKTKKPECYEFFDKLLVDIHVKRLRENGITSETVADLRVYLTYLRDLEGDGNLREFIEKRGLVLQDENFQRLICFYDNAHHTQIGSKYNKSNILRDFSFLSDVKRADSIQERLLDLSLGIHLGKYFSHEINGVYDELEKSLESLAFCRAFSLYFELVWIELRPSERLASYVTSTCQILEKCIEECKEANLGRVDQLESVKAFYGGLYKAYAMRFFEKDHAIGREFQRKNPSFSIEEFLISLTKKLFNKDPLLFKVFTEQGFVIDSPEKQASFFQKSHEFFSALSNATLTRDLKWETDAILKGIEKKMELNSL